MQLTRESSLAIQQLNLADHEIFTILKDFETFLEKLTDKPVSLSKGKKQLPVKWAQALNAEFSVPSVVQLNRPLTIHYPLVLGFQMLVVAVGLGKIEGSVKGASILQIIPEMLAQWQKMNDAERYFGLLQAWLNRGHSAIIGERLRRMDDRFLFSFGSNLLNDEFWQGQPPHRKDSLDRMPKYMGAYHIALLKAFGLAVVEFTDSSNKLRQFQLTGWGSAFLSNCRSEVMRLMMDDSHDGDDIELAIIEATSGCRSDMKLVLIDSAVTTGDFVLKVTLDGYPCWC